MKRFSSFLFPLTLASTIPLTLALAALGELVLRAVPLEEFAFRALEGLYRPDPSGAPFRPDRVFRRPRTYGDLASMGNLPMLRQFRSEVFTTDHWGFRNTPPSRPGPPVAILTGDSFGYASGVEDSQTLPARLERRWGGSVYNASGLTPAAGPPVPSALNLARFRAVARRLGMDRGLVIYEYLERVEIPRRPPAGPSRVARAQAPEALGVRIERVARQLWATSRLRILAERAYRKAENGWMLPNPYAAKVVARRLANGETMLFLPEEVDAHARRRPVSAEYWIWLQQELERDGLSLVVLLVPNKYTVYGSLLDPPVRPGAPGAGHLERVEEALRSAGVPVVNLTKSFQVRARRQLADGEHLYWRDDTHWTGLGMEIAAEELARAIPNPSR